VAEERGDRMRETTSKSQPALGRGEEVAFGEEGTKTRRKKKNSTEATRKTPSVLLRGIDYPKAEKKDTNAETTQSLKNPAQEGAQR